MSIFQKSVLQKHLNNLDKEKVENAYAAFKTIYSAEKIEKIKQLKEEEYQDGFLRDVFVDVLGYILKPNDNYNLVREFKNQTDSKKADGAILNHDKVVAVIELKSTSTKDLTTVTQQAFNYKNNQPGCRYVITSNFQKLRFYVENSTEYESFDLFDLSREEFGKLFLLLSKKSILSDLPEKIKKESAFHEENVTKQLYADYKAFKDRIFDNLVKGNPQYDKLTLFKKAQKLLDRILFILFAEDKGLIPPNTMKQIISDWEAVCKRNRYEPLYNFFKDYFGYINKGFVIPDFGEIPAYNGGLFIPDEILDSPDLKLPDGLLQNYTPVLSKYDFSSEVDVNILGHIFEHSLSEIEEFTAELQGKTLDSTKTKRKKDGIFYTPKYITKYIVESTVGALCNEQKAKLKLGELDIDSLYSYKSWLLTLKILDPACGSGAFLNQALDFLIAEHQFIDELIESISGVKADTTNNDKAILENNIYGVDINEESIEIAKLSLWLRTAKRGRALSDLSGNIKCGNSLIDDKTIDPEKAFVWEKEFPNVFGFHHQETESSIVIKKEVQPNYLNLIEENAKMAIEKAKLSVELSKEALEYTQKVYEYIELQKQSAGEPLLQYGNTKGGFDVVIGNPPYVRLETMKEISEGLSKMQYKTFVKRGDLYVLFVEQGFKLLKPNGFISYIMPNKWMQAGYGKPLREYFLNYELKQLIDFGDIQIFEGATTYPCIFVSRKAIPQNEIKVSVLKEANKDDFNTNVISTCQIFKTESFSGETWVISSNNDQALLEKLKAKFKTLSEFVGGEANYGIKTGLTEAFLVNEQTKDKFIEETPKAAKLIVPFIQGRDIDAYTTPNIVSNLLLIKKGLTNKSGSFNNEEAAWNWFSSEYKSIANWLFNYSDKCKKRTDKGDYWWELRACDYYDNFAIPKIMYQTFQVKPCFIFDEQGLFCNNSMWIIPTNNKGLLAILNSKMGWWLITKYCTQIQNGYQLIWKYFGQIPIANINSDLAVKADQMLSLHKALQEKSEKFTRNLQREFGLENLSKKLENWYELSYADFLKELEKHKVKLTLSKKAEWEEYFMAESKAVKETNSSINQTEQEIDLMVYELYELTPQEIHKVENSVK